MSVPIFTDCIIITGSCFCPMDASSKAFSFEETTRRGTLSHSLLIFLWMLKRPLDVMYTYATQLNFLLKSHSLKIKKSKTFVPSEASRSNLHCASRRWDWILWSGARSWPPWSCGVWIQWSVCTPTHTYHWVCPRSSLQYSFLSTAVGSQVSKCYIRVDEILTSITDEYAIDLLLLQAFFFSCLCLPISNGSVPISNGKVTLLFF